AEFKPKEYPNVRAPLRKPVKISVAHAQNRPDPVTGIWTVASIQPRVDAERLLAEFLPKAFRRPVDPVVVKHYVARVEERIQAGDCFESAMRWASRAALCSPDFLYHVEPSGGLDDAGLACRLSYFLWNSMPDEPLRKLAASGKLRGPIMLRTEVDRMLTDPKS